MVHVEIQVIDIFRQKSSWNAQLWQSNRCLISLVHSTWMNNAFMRTSQMKLKRTRRNLRAKSISLQKVWKFLVMQIKNHEILISIDDVAEKRGRKHGKSCNSVPILKIYFIQVLLKSGFYSREFFISARVWLRFSPSFYDMCSRIACCV